MSSHCYDRALTVGEMAWLAQGLSDPSRSLAPARPANQAAVGHIDVDVSAGATPLTVQFNSGKSFDPEGDSFTYAWDFGDGGTATSENPSYTFEQEGEYVVTSDAD